MKLVLSQVLFLKMRIDRCYISLTMIRECLVDLTGCLQLNPTCCDGEGHNIWRKLSAIGHTPQSISMETAAYLQSLVFQQFGSLLLKGMKWIYFVTSTDKTSQTLPLFQTNSSLVYCADKQYSV